MHSAIMYFPLAEFKKSASITSKKNVRFLNL